MVIRSMNILALTDLDTCDISASFLADQVLVVDRLFCDRSDDVEPAEEADHRKRVVHSVGHVDLLLRQDVLEV